MSASVERSVQKCVHDLQHQPCPDHARAEGDHIRVVVVARRLGAEHIVTERAAYAVHFIGGDRHADPRTADQDTEIALAQRDAFRRRQCVIGVVDGLRAVRPEINVFDFIFLQIIRQDRL